MMESGIGIKHIQGPPTLQMLAGGVDGPVINKSFTYHRLHLGGGFI